MPNVLERVSRVALDLLFPPRCAICDVGGDVLCAFCTAGFPLAVEPRCDRCWDEIRFGLLCAHCVASPPAFESARAIFAHDAGARRLVHLLKYESLSSLAEPMARLMAGAVDPSLIDLIVPVPLHRGRERSRGYNQSALLVQHIARATELSASPRAASRVRATKPLVQSMSSAERSAIVHGAFTASEERVEGRRVLLVDDVMTTGATLNACTRALLDAGAIEVRALTFVRA